jgi:type VI secretion system secreted protein Hcp
VADDPKDKIGGGPLLNVQRYRFRVVAPDGRELVSQVVHVPITVVRPPEVLQVPYPVTSMRVAVTGARQGAFQAEIPGTSANEFAALDLDYQMISSLDPASGLPTGRRQHSPLAIVKEWGVASPQLFTALFVNEVLTTVEIHCFGRDQNGVEKPVHQVKLTNAVVVSINQMAGISQADRRDRPALERVAFAFQRIEHTSAAGTAAVDDWGASRV